MRNERKARRRRDIIGHKISEGIPGLSFVWWTTEGWISFSHITIIAIYTIKNLENEVNGNGHALAKWFTELSVSTRLDLTSEGFPLGLIQRVEKNLESTKEKKKMRQNCSLAFDHSTQCSFYTFTTCRSLQLRKTISVIWAKCKIFSKVLLVNLMVRGDKVEWR